MISCPGTSASSSSIFFVLAHATDVMLWVCHRDDVGVFGLDVGVLCYWGVFGCRGRVLTRVCVVGAGVGVGLDRGPCRCRCPCCPYTGCF